MPLLPTRNNLDYNPNSVVDASRKIKTISLANMKNPILDPDMKTLSSMDAERNLKGNLELLGKMLIDVETDLFRLTQISGTTIASGYADMMGSGNGSKKSNSDLGLDKLFKTRRGRPKGSKTKKLTKFNISQIPTSEATSTPQIGATATPQSGIVSQERQGRFNPNLTPNQSNSQATPMGDPDDSDPDDDASSLGYSASTLASRTNRSRSASIASSSSSYPDFYNVNSLPSVITNLIIGLNSKIQKIDFFLNSKIKPAYRKLDASQQAFLARFLQTIYVLYQNTFRDTGEGVYITDYSNNLEEFIFANVDAGDNLLSILKRNLDKLILDTTITLNASKQMSIDGDTSVNTELADNYALKLSGFVGSGRNPRMIGLGRNFYGEKINNTLDIPNIRTSYMNCPTKYLL